MKGWDFDLIGFALCSNVRLKVCEGLVKVVLDFLDKSLPLLSTFLATICFSSNNYIVREPIIIAKFRLRHDWLSFNNHIDFDFNLLCDHLWHAVLITFIDHCDDEVHEDHVSNDHNHNPNKPCKGLTFICLKERIHFEISYWCSKGHQEECKQACVYIGGLFLRIFVNDDRK